MSILTIKLTTEQLDEVVKVVRNRIALHDQFVRPGSHTEAELARMSSLREALVELTDRSRDYAAESQERHAKARAILAI